jgi:hypothetical protein
MTQSGHLPPTHDIKIQIWIHERAVHIR